MSGLVQWDPKTPTEIVLRYADFTDELESAEYIQTCTCTATVWSGNDVSPQSIISTINILENSAGIAAVGTVAVQGGVLGTIYQCVCTGTTNFGHTITKTAILAVVPPY